MLNNIRIEDRVYIAGPMTGRDNYNYDQFNEVAKFLRDKGFSVVNNPAEHFDGDQGLPWHVYLHEALRAVMESDAVVALPGWSESVGARLEVAVAIAIGIVVYEYIDEWGYVEVTMPDRRLEVAALLGMKHVLYDIDDESENPDMLPHEEAATLVHGARQANYGHPLDNFTGTAGIWNGIVHKKLNAPLTAEDVALCMVGVKLSRETHVSKRDNLVDAHGYLMTYQMVKDERERRDRSEV